MEPRTHCARFSEFRFGSWISWAAMGIASLLAPMYLMAVDAVGMPPSRFYSLGDIADLSPGFKLGFDPLGRLAVIQNLKYVVLNDDEWVNLVSDEETIHHALAQVVYAPDGVGYFASHSHWGALRNTWNGKVVPESASPSKRPDWTLAGEFDRIFVLDHSVIFYNWNGLIHWDRNTGEHRYLEIRGLERIFRAGDALYLSILYSGVRQLSLDPLELHALAGESDVPSGLRHATSINRQQVLFSHPDDGFWIFDGSSFRIWNTSIEHEDYANISGLCCLANGSIAVAIERKGIVVLDPEGDAILSLVSPEYQGVREMAANEPGVFWYSTELGVGKVLYGDRVTVVDERSGLVVGWPHISRWDGGIVIASEGRIYESVGGRKHGTLQFRLVDGQPAILNLAASARGRHLLVGNAEGVVGKVLGDSFEPILDNIDVVRLSFLDDEHCLVVGSSEIAVIRWQGTEWVECAGRISGFGFPSVIHAIAGSVWIELGLDRVARITYAEGKLSSTLFEQFPWEYPAWVNIGYIGDRVIMSGPDGQRLYYDTATDTICEAPDLDALFQLCPYGMWRTLQDSRGTIWISHTHGVSELRRVHDHYRFHLGMTRIIREPTPILQLMDSGELWVISRRSLFHVIPATDWEPGTTLKPQLVSVTDERTGSLFPLNVFNKDGGSIDYQSNTLTFRFFSGSYAFNGLSYRVEMEGSHVPWTIPKSHSNLTVPNLKEGSYRMVVSLMGGDVPLGEPLVLQFSVRPPWFRSSLAYAAYGFLMVVFLVLLASVPVSIARNRNRILSRLVEERTHELEQTMLQLREEERSRAIHEERSRIAHEIHDSVQQGLSGLKLILDSTLKYASIPDDLKARLQRAKTILSFTHQEVKHAVWDMESPMIKEENLCAALEEVSALVDSPSTEIRVMATGVPVALNQSTHHHLVRIAQESLTNAIRHGNAHHIDIQLHYGPEQVRLSIRDDGCGFDVQKATNSPHQLGLRGVLNRAKRCEGVATIESEPVAGTCITICVPSGKERQGHE